MYMHASLELHANASKSERDAEYDNKKTEQNGRHGSFRTGACATRSSPPRASCVHAITTRVSILRHTGRISDRQSAARAHLILSLRPSFSLLSFSRSSFSLSNNLRRLSSFRLPAITSLASFSRSFLALSSRPGRDDRADESTTKGSESSAPALVGDEPGAMGDDVGGAVSESPPPNSDRWMAWKGESGSLRIASNPDVCPAPAADQCCPCVFVGVTGPCDADPAKLSKRGFLAGEAEAGVEGAGVGRSASSISSSISASSEAKSMSSKLSS